MPSAALFFPYLTFSLYINMKCVELLNLLDNHNQFPQSPFVGRTVVGSQRLSSGLPLSIACAHAFYVLYCCGIGDFDE